VSDGVPDVGLPASPKELEEEVFIISIPIAFSPETIGTRCNFHIFHKNLHLGLSDSDFGISGTG
jgi:hypothetical protein